MVVTREGGRTVTGTHTPAAMQACTRGLLGGSVGAAHGGRTAAPFSSNGSMSRASIVRRGASSACPRVSPAARQLLELGPLLCMQPHISTCSDCPPAPCACSPSCAAS
eukprot:364651-Chlamydomonas_euryale.AAC.10